MSAIAARTRIAEERHPLWLLGAAALGWLGALQGAAAVLGLAALRRLLASAGHALGGRAPLLPLRHDQDPAAARRDHLRRPHPRSFLSIERTRALLGGKREGLGNVAAAGLGVATPFCSCSAVPAFIGFVAAGVPLGVTLSFLIASPMVNEVAIVLLYGLFGFKIAALYIGSGLLIAIVAGARPRPDAAGALHRAVRARGRRPRLGRPGSVEVQADLGGADRARPRRGALDPRQGIWPYLLAGIALGAAIHGWVPTDFFARYAGPHNPLAVPFAVLLGVPLYSNAAGVLPLIEALHAKGLAMGTLLAFMMAVVALSLPEMILLRRVLRPQLLGIYIAVVAAGIVATGFLFNADPLKGDPPCPRSRCSAPAARTANA